MLTVRSGAAAEPIPTVVLVWLLLVVGSLLFVTVTSSDREAFPLIAENTGIVAVVTVITGNEPPPATGPGCAHDFDAVEHDQPVPDADANP